MEPGKCKHPYYHYVAGVLVCTECSTPSKSPKALKITDNKAVKTSENKALSTQA